MGSEEGSAMWFWLVAAAFSAWGAVCGVWLWILLVQIFARRKSRELFLPVSANPDLTRTSRRTASGSADLQDRPAGSRSHTGGSWSHTGAETGTELPSVRIIVPVRNLGRRIMPCLESILAQDYANLRLTLIDDRSEDDTYAWLARIAATDPRVKVHHVETLPAGWLGKSHALWAASKTAGEEWLLFIDDDCHLDPGAVRTTVRYAAAHDLDLLTLWPRHLAGSFWEHAVIPLCGAIIALWF
ncbi:MAG: glycosyltransferase family 2 protein, partial [Planctomycetes bacterium]|nr:glycosyltransferase family 2 protein [Planctomycetota bacterium]